MSELYDPNGDWLGTADPTSVWVEQLRMGGWKLAAYSRDNNETYFSIPIIRARRPRTRIIWGR